MISTLHALLELFRANPLAQSMGLLGLAFGVLCFVQRDDQRLRVMLTIFSVVMGLHFFLMGGTTAAFAAWLSGLRSYVSSRTRHFAVMLFFIVLVWVLGIPKITQPIQWLTVIATTIGTWALYRERGIRMRVILMLSTVFWMTHNYVIGSIGGAVIETCFLFVNGHTIFRLWQGRTNG